MHGKPCRYMRCGGQGFRGSAHSCVSDKRPSCRGRKLRKTCRNWEIVDINPPLHVELQSSTEQSYTCIGGKTTKKERAEENKIVLETFSLMRIWHINPMVRWLRTSLREAGSSSSCATQRPPKDKQGRPEFWARVWPLQRLL